MIRECVENIGIAWIRILIELKKNYGNIIKTITDHSLL